MASLIANLKRMLSGESKDTRNSQISQVLEQAIDAVVSIDENNHVTFYNRAAEKLWGYSPEEVLGQNVKMLVPAEIRGHHDNYIDTNRTTGRDKIVGTSREVEVHRKDGTVIWGNLSLSKVVTDDKITYTAFVKDITEEKLNRDMIDQTLEQALDAVVTIDENNHVTFFNAAAEALWGYERKDVIGQNVKMLVPADIRGNHDQFVNRNRKTAQDKIVGTSREVPITRPDGRECWAALSLSKIQVGDKILYTAFLKDITEERARREEFKTLSLVANKTDNSVIITDPQGLIQYVNPGFEKLTGYTLEEVRGRKPGSFLQGELTDKNTVARIRQKLDAREPFYDEILNYDQDGSTYWISLAINPVFNDQGELEKFISIQANITETKKRSQEFYYKLNAIDRANLVLELDLNGHIQLANDNLLKAVGYSASELKGKHLNKLMATDFSHTDASREIWRKLEAGDFASGEYKFADSRGEAVWISGSFNPILGEDGKPVSYVAYAINVTTRKNAINAISESLLALSDGDLTTRVNGSFDAEFNRVKDAFNSSVKRIQETLLTIHAVSDEVSQVADDLVLANRNLSARSESTAATLEETAASIEELTSASQANSDNANSAYTMAEQSEQSAERGQQVVEKAVTAMQKINESSIRIADIIEVINDIAFQTNLLALNAAVEAARAGDQGRGFAVVAGEVRNLAQRSASSAKEIEQLIKASNQNVKVGTELVNSSGDTLKEINHSILKVNEMIRDIRDSSEQQLAGITQINVSVADIDQATQQNVTMVEESMKNSSMLLERSGQMKADLAFFRLR